MKFSGYLRGKPNENWGKLLDFLQYACRDIEDPNTSAILGKL